MTLVVRQVLTTLTRADVGVCAKRCLDTLLCRGFMYSEASKQCHLSSNDVAASGLTSSDEEEFYELRSRRAACGMRFRCHNERCVTRDKLCDGVDTCGDNSDEADCSLSTKHELKLVGGQGPHEGNIQVKVDGEWGYVCDDGFGFEAADLVCRSLGYPAAQVFTRNNKFGSNDSAWRRSRPKFWLDKLSCTGHENSLFQCPSSGLGVHDCGATEIAGVVCRTTATLCATDQFQCGTPRLHTCVSRTQVCDEAKDCFDGSDEAPSLCDDVGVTRLITTSSHLTGTTAGTVYIKHFGRWGTVCDDGFDETHAKVVCRSLGYESGWAVPYPRAFFGRGTGDIILDEPGCKGGESWLGECLGVVWGLTDCDHAEDVGVLCSDEMEVRLSNGPTANSGRVEVKLSGQWGTICDDDFDDYEAKVVCGMLGYHGDAVAHKQGRYGQGTGPVWLDSMDCLGTESDLRLCKKSQPGASDCTHSEDAAVTCYSVRRGRINIGLQTALPDGCGQRPDSSSSFLIDNFAKIIGGSTQQPLEQPWLVSLQLREEGKLKHNCGGVVIAEDYVLTAAHCFKVHGRHSYVVRVGDYSLNTRENDQEDFQIEKLWMHEDFDTTVEFNNDLAVLKVARKNGRGIRFGQSVQPACLPSEEATYNGLTDCSITGWGTTSERAPPVPQDLPRTGQVQVYDMPSCIGQNKYGMFEVTSGMVCAGNLDGRIDTCTGDSGGPLTCKVNGRHVLYGITSWGKGCGRRGQPGMYTKITKFLRWIHDIIV
ncbi:neurotrypsin-like [Cherax quadricarinatus]